jgi:methionyl-tRNA formyltransferase
MKPQTASTAFGSSLARPLNILVVGEESAGIQLVRRLARGPHRIVGVLASAEVPGGKAASLWGLAQNLGLRTAPATRVKDSSLAKDIRAEQVDVLLNVHSLHVINWEVLVAPRFGSFNLHPGPLPHYAGLNCMSWALYHGERYYGVTLHKMEPEIDTGPIAGQAPFEIGDADTALSLSLKCVRAGLPLIYDLLQSAAETGVIPVHEQNLSKRHYYGKEVPDGGWLDWSRASRAIFNFVRACDYLPFRSPWGHPQTRLNGHKIGIVKATLLNQPANVPPGTVGLSVASVVPVACGDDWLGVKTLFFDGKYRDAAELLSRGMRFEGMPETLLGEDPKL